MMTTMMIMIMIAANSKPLPPNGDTNGFELTKIHIICAAPTGKVRACPRTEIQVVMTSMMIMIMISENSKPLPPNGDTNGCELTKIHIICAAPTGKVCAFPTIITALASRCSMSGCVPSAC
jgi:hypothetical protein